MPEHCHLIAMEAACNRTPLRRWIGWWKQQASTNFEAGSLVWQRDVWDTTIRSQEMMAQKVAYIQNNPIRRGLVKSVEEWPFQGELYRLNWIGG
jgi:putative transposase